MHNDDEIFLTFLTVVAVERRKFHSYSMLPSSLVARGRLRKDKLIEQTFELIPVIRLTILLIVFGVVRPSKASAKTKICELNVSFLIDQNIVRLDVSVLIKRHVIK